MDTHRPPATTTEPARIAGRTVAAPTLAEILLMAGGLIVSLAILLRVQIETGFTSITGDIYDGRIEVSLLEHWFNVLRGVDIWNRPGYFYPHADTLGYNDGYLLFGLIFSVFRSVGIEPILASEFVNICVRMVGYGAFIALAVDLAAIPLGWATLGAVLFTISNGMYIQEIHQQLLAISFAPLLFWLLWRGWTALPLDPRRATLYGSAASLLYGAWLLTSFYMAWFAAFFGLLTLLALIAMHAATGRSLRPALARLACRPVAVTLAVLAVSLLPFLDVYLPTAAETGQHSFAETLALTPSVADLIHVGDQNLLFGGVDHWMAARFDQGSGALTEHIVGFSPLLLLTALVGLWAIWMREPKSPGDALMRPSPGRALMRAMSVATAVALALCLRAGTHGLWYYVFAYVPGAAAIRAETRLLLFLDLPVVMLAIWAMADRARVWSASVVAIVALLLVAGELNTSDAQQLDRRAEIAVTAAVPRVPAGCRSFYVTNRGSQAHAGSPEIDALYHHAVDAMMIGALRGIPTIDGFATFSPADARFIARLPTTVAAVRSYARDHGVRSGVCGLDLDRDRWIAPLPAPSFLPADGVIRFAAPGENADGFVARGWSAAEHDGRWTDGNAAGLEMRLPETYAGRALSLSVDAMPFAPGDAGSSGIWVQVDGKTIAHWPPVAGQQHFTATIAPDAVPAGTAFSITFQIVRPLSPHATTGVPDDRALGFMFKTVSIVPTGS